MDNKERRPFEVFMARSEIVRDGYVNNFKTIPFARGIYYPDGGNVQVTWRIDKGYCAQQYSNIGEMMFLEPRVKGIRWL